MLGLKRVFQCNYYVAYGYQLTKMYECILFIIKVKFSEVVLSCVIKPLLRDVVTKCSFEIVRIVHNDKLACQLLGTCKSSAYILSELIKYPLYKV